MKEVPICLKKSYQAFDDLISDMYTACEKRSTISVCDCGCKRDRNIKLMCDFWNIIREDPNCNLQEAVQESIDLNEFESQSVISQSSKCMTCYMASCCPKSDGGGANCPRKKPEKPEESTSGSANKTCCDKLEAEGRKSCRKSGAGTCSCQKMGAQMLKEVKSEPQKNFCCRKTEDDREQKGPQKTKGSASGSAKKSCCDKLEEEGRPSCRKSGAGTCSCQKMGAQKEAKSEPKNVCCQKMEDEREQKGPQKTKGSASGSAKKSCCDKLEAEGRQSCRKSGAGTCSCQKMGAQTQKEVKPEPKKLCCQKMEEEEPEQTGCQRIASGTCCCQKKGGQKSELRISEPDKKTCPKPSGGTCSCQKKGGSAQKAETRFSEPEKKGPCSRCGSSKDSDRENAPSVCPSTTSGDFPLSTVLGNLKKAAKFEEKCSDKITKLKESEGELKDAIQNLEAKEKEGAQKLKEADCMWACMEDSYKKKLQESTDRQKALQKELKDVEASTKKWRKNMKDLESAIDKADKARTEIREKICQKSNDIKCIDMDIKDLNKRYENSKKEIEAAKKAQSAKQNASERKLAHYKEEIRSLEEAAAEEEKKKRDKEEEGTKYVRQAREDLQQICGILLRKKLLNEDLKAEKEALAREIDILLQAREKCKDKCDLKQKSLEKEIKNISREIGDQKSKCGRCNQCTDTAEIQNCCTDCPRCTEDRRCAVKGDHCSADHSMDCVCMTVKKKFLDNVFENMYTVLDRQIKKGAGKGVADQILECLQRSRNGKLDERSRKALQEFILTTVKKHLNLTIVGGAVKTRCEMDPEVYQQLMVCLQQVQVPKPQKVDKGTLSKKDPCRRWGGTSECNCPKGPQGCICLKKAPPPPHDPAPCPPDDDVDESNLRTCPYREKTICGPDCGKESEKVNKMMKDMAKSRCDSCQGSTCKFMKNMRTAACVVDREYSGKKNISAYLKEQSCDCPPTAGFSKHSADTKKSKSMTRQNLHTHLLLTTEHNTQTSKSTFNLDDYCTKLAKTSSDAVIINFNNNFLNLVEEKMKARPPLHPILKVTNSGHLQLQFTYNKNNVDVNRVMILENVLPGCLFFKGNRNVSKMLQKIDDISPCNSMMNKFDHKKPNAVLRKIPLGIVLIIATEPLELVEKRLIALSPETYTKVKVMENNNRVVDFPGVLKSTPSRNYILAVDKEFEKYFQDTVKYITGNDNTAILTLRKTASGSQLVQFGCCDIGPDTEIAILKKTRSGNLKILSNVPRDLCLLKEVTSDNVHAAKLFNYCIDLLQKLQNFESHKVDTKVYSCHCSNEYELFNKTENNIEKRHHVNEPVKKIISDEKLDSLYEEFKIEFINKIKDFLLEPPISLPVRDTISDNVILMLRKHGSKLPVACIKMARPRNTNTSFNENVEDDGFLSIYSKGNDFVTNYKHPTSKLVDVRTSLSPNSCTCGSSSNDMNVEYRIPKLIYSRSNNAMEYSSKCVSFPLLPSTVTLNSGKALPHIVIKPAVKKSCVCSGGNNSTGNDSSISGYSNTVNNYGDNHFSRREERTRHWDSLSYLPPQLPPFLGDIAQLYN